MPELTEEQVQRLAKLVLWVAQCPFKLTKGTVNAIFDAITTQLVLERLERMLPKPPETPK